MVVLVQHDVASQSEGDILTECQTQSQSFAEIIDLREMSEDSFLVALRYACACVRHREQPHAVGHIAAEGDASFVSKLLGIHQYLHDDTLEQPSVALHNDVLVNTGRVVET